MNDFHINFTNHGLSTCHPVPVAPSLEVAKKVSATIPPRTFTDNLWDYCEALGKSRIIKHLLFATGIALAIAFLVTPPGWIASLSAASLGVIAGFVTLALTLGLNLLLDKKGWLGAGEKLALETSCISERLGRKNFSQITENRPESGLGNLFVGGLPARMNNDLEKMKEAGITCVISLNSKWEKKCRGPSLPYTREDYKRAGIEFIELDCVDHQPLSMGDMDLISDLIHARIQTKNNVLIHCRAGKGRSVLGVLAYLMKACGLSKGVAAAQILAHRPQATVNGKKGRKAQADYEKHIYSKWERLLHPLFNNDAVSESNVLHNAFQKQPKSLSFSEINDLAQKLIEERSMSKGVVRVFQEEDLP